jgi:SAM-dependent methyltransferase
MLPDAMKRIIRQQLSSAKRTSISTRKPVARVIRSSVRPIEKITPSLSRKIKSWGWVWQPTRSHKHFNALYDNAVDPYRFGSNQYETDKYEHTIRLLSGRLYDSALEIGASEGIFTRMIAPHCKSLVAIDVARSAVERARIRLADFDYVSVRQASIPHQLPNGPFDLIVASDVLYYFPKDLLVCISHEIADKLSSDGIFFVLHYLGDTDHELNGGEVHRLLKGHLDLEVIHDETVVGVGPKEAGYAVTIFEKTG